MTADIRTAAQRGHSQMRVWHDEAQRLERTGRLDEGPCWCGDCIVEELAEGESSG